MTDMWPEYQVSDFVDECGLEKHLPIPVNDDDQGPTGYGETPSRYMCWCDEDCLWNQALNYNLETNSPA